MDGKQDYDVLDFIYEDLIRKFAANAGKKTGELYTLRRFVLNVENRRRPLERQGTH